MTQKQIGVKHPLIKHFLKLKKGSKEYPNSFIAEGAWMIEKLMHSDALVDSLFICEDLLTRSQADLVKSLADKSEHVFLISKKIATQISEKDNGSAILAIITKIGRSLDTILSESERVVILDGLESHGNIGTIFRTCDASKVDAVLIVNEKAKINNHMVIKSSMGGCFHVPWTIVDSVGACEQALKTHGFTTVLATPDAKVDFRHAPTFSKPAVIVGNERYGISTEWDRQSSFQISIPMHGVCDSLNVGVAASIIIYDLSMRKNA
ncbi:MULTISPECIES: RNA methyltransferase [unclassified Fusibacter]|uniref:TrmH family RNA methyltransferase n=1 Tax=unclassified Fusibacter TaxID=2624464 RepID=UPI0010109FD9|nr:MULTISPECIES: RNA methyltransferase [unclassified Fusibacter]MCK8059151.1 RNA methyltransferase [Fusibacter sp. A2]NPE22560.1 RNA methyltransferase [Fusibacter sp. A1]RXV60663.1 RNA methyltransferase [Fusibacter sp. A1]